MVIFTITMICNSQIMNPDIDIIYYTLFPWENAYSSVSLSFTREFCKNNRVFYINKPYSIKDYWGVRKTELAKERQSDLFKNRMRYEEIKELPDNVVAVHPPLTVPINFLSDGMMYRKLAEKNNQVVVDTVRQVVKDYKLKNYIYLNCYNPYHGALMPPDMGQMLNIYQCIDDMMEEPYTAKHGARLEDEVIAKADMVTCTSHQLHNLKSPLNSNTHIIHNAVDLNIFNKALEEKYPVPEEMKHIKTKTIGFTGNLDPNRIDYALIRKVAEKHSDKTVVLVGPVNSDEFAKNGLDKQKNIISTGPKHIRELPKYLQHFDCVLIPFKLNTLCASIYPLKINEYLAAGKAVISTNFSVDIRGFSDVIYLGKNETEFMQLIDKAIAENSEEKIAERVAKAKQNTWTARVEQFWKVVNATLEKKGMLVSG